MDLSKNQEFMDWYDKFIHAPSMSHPNATEEMKRSFRLTRSRLDRLPTKSKIQFFWSAIIGTDKSITFSKLLKELGIIRFEDTMEDFRERFNDDWLRDQ